MVALPAVLVLMKLKMPVLLLMVVALPAVLVPKNSRVPVLAMVALPPLMTMPGPVKMSD